MFFSSFVAIMNAIKMKYDYRYSFSVDVLKFNLIFQVTAEIINELCLKANQNIDHCYKSIDEDPSNQEVFLSAFPCVNLYVSSLIIQKYDLQTLIRFKKNELQSALNEILPLQRIVIH
jgi:hypothetical protein